MQAAFKNLKIDLVTLAREAGVEQPLHGDLSPEFLRRGLAGTDAEVREGGQASLSVLLQPDQTVLVRGRVDLQFWVPCARCLEPSWVDGGSELCLTFLPESQRPAWVESEDEDLDALADEELEILYYSGRSIDLAAVLSEQVALAYPMRVLCARGQACRGLCSGCGTELNALPPDQRVCSCGRAIIAADAAAEGPETPWKRALAGLNAGKSRPS